MPGWPERFWTYGRGTHQPAPSDGRKAEATPRAVDELDLWHVHVQGHRSFEVVDRATIRTQSDDASASKSLFVSGPCDSRASADTRPESRRSAYLR